MEKYEIFANTEKYRNPLLWCLYKLIEGMSKIVKSSDITVGTEL
jgi:hypothetical protein